MSLDNFIESKVGFGKAQYIPFIFLCLIDLNDGAQLLLSSFLTSIIKYQWELSSTIASLLASIFYVGVLFGSAISGRLSDIYGRRIIIILGSILQLMSSLTFFVVNSTVTMALARLVYGFSFGFSIAITTSMFAQSSTLQYRGKGLLFLNFCVSLGKLFGLALAYIFLTNFHQGNWRGMMVCSCLPNILVLYGSIFIMKESPRFLLANHRFQEAFQVLNHMTITNNPHSNLISEGERQQLIMEQKQKFRSSKAEASLFSPQFRTLTLCLCTCWFSINFTYFGQLVVLPFIFGKQNQQFSAYALTVLGQAPSFLLSLYLVDKENFGRRNSMGYFFMLSASLHLLFAFQSLTIVGSFCRFFMKLCFQMLYPCTTQCFGTKIRTLGFGFCSAMGRVGAVVMPYIVVPMVDNHQQLIFILFFMVNLGGSYTSFKIPKEPLNSSLDPQNHDITTKFNS